MDEVVGDEVADHVDDTQIRIKEQEFSLKPGSSDMWQSDEMVTPAVGDYPETNLDRIGSSEHASSSPRCMDEGVMVEELTLKKYDGENLTIVGTSDNRERMKARRSPWQHLYQISGGQIGNREKGQVASGVVGDGDSNLLSDLLDQNQPKPDNCNELINDSGTHDKVTPGNTYPSGGIRTKIVSKSGFSEYFIKSTLRGKGEIHKIPAPRGPGAETRDLVHSKSGLSKSDALLNVAAQTLPPSSSVSEPRASLNLNSVGNGTSLREWLGGRRYKSNKEESLRIFRHVLDLVDLSHSHGVPIQDLRPSCFKLLSSQQVVYVGSSVHSNIKENVIDQDTQLSYRQNEKRPLNRSMLNPEIHSLKRRNLGEHTSISQRWPQFPSRSGVRSATNNASDDVDEERNLKTDPKNQIIFSGPSRPSPLQQLQPSVSFMLEEKWYSSPELLDEKRSTFASNIYCLGLILFELLASFDSGRSHAAAMQDLRHRILPPRFLSENPKEAGFCLWLLHPEPSLRPTTSEILQSEFISGIQEVPADESPVSMDEEDGNSELLLYFLLALNEQKQKDASHLVEQIHRVEADIREVEKRRPGKLPVVTSSLQESLNARGNYYLEGGNPCPDVLSKMSPAMDKESRFLSNVRQLESVYFSMRSNIQSSSSNDADYRDTELLKSRENLWSTRKEKKKKYGAGDNLGSFFDGLCKYARYKKLRVRGVLRNGEFNSSANVICSLSFDRDENYLAAGGVSKKIKVFEYEALLNDSVDIHYPVVEMANKSKLSCICWNSYIRNYLASTDYDGTVKLWDASTGQGFCNFAEHSARAWSVDFSRVNPMKLASGSDDRSVKIWSINDKNSLCTIRNNANVCCVQFSEESSHLLAFSSADYKIYCYDLRNASIPWCILAGHEKTVSYAKFLDAGTVVSASTDNTLKIWDLSKTSSNSLSRDACVSTLRGHTNEKNFVGLSVADGYITCGSETNEVYAYYKSLSMPITAYKFGSIDPITGKETEDDNGQFVSSVCWRRKSNMVVAANSSGCIKLLEMV